MSGFGSGAVRGDFTRTSDLGIRRWGLSGSEQRDHADYEDTLGRRWIQILGIHACESFGCLGSDTLGFGICQGRISEKLDDSAAHSALEKAFVPCFENSAPGARGAACKPKGSVCVKAENFSAHAYVYKNQE